MVDRVNNTNPDVTPNEAASTAPARAASRTAKQLAAEQEKDERGRAAEVKLNESDDRFTSPELITAIEDAFGRIDFDPCWHPSSFVRPDAHLDVRKGQNGLRDAWSGRFAFVNPPWSGRDKWVRRCYDQWTRGNVEMVVCLVRSATDSKFLHEIIARDADVYFIQGRPRFHKEDRTSEPTMGATMIVILGADARQKARFAELVPGSWWAPIRPSAVRIRQAWDGSTFRVYEHGPVSCASQNIHRTVICNPGASALSSASI